MDYEQKNCAVAEKPVDSEIVKQVKICLELTERLDNDISMLKAKLSPVTKLEELPNSTEPNVKTLANTRVGEVISSLEDRIKSACWRIQGIHDSIEV